MNNTAPILHVAHKEMHNSIYQIDAFQHHTQLSWTETSSTDYCLQSLFCTLHTMDDDDADYMQGSDDEVCIINRLNWRCLRKAGLRLRLFGQRRWRKRVKNYWYRKHVLSGKVWVWHPLQWNSTGYAHCATPAKKEDSPEDALSDFQTIVEQEQEKSDWCIYLDVFFELVLNARQGFQGAEAVN